jgi:hypothetical protein
MKTMSTVKRVRSPWISLGQLLTIAIFKRTPAKFFAERRPNSFIWRRARYAFIHYLVVRADAGMTIPACSRFAGTYGASFIANEWYPASRANTSHALLRGTTAFMVGPRMEIFREFWPDITNAIHHHRKD